MKRIKSINGVNIYDIIKSRDNVAEAVKEACRDHARDPTVVRIRENPDKYIDAVCQILEDETYRPSGFRFKRIFERGKWRELCYTRTFPDRMVHHAVMRVVAPILLRSSVRDSCAAIPGKGLHRGTKRLHEDIETDADGTRYCLKLDVRRYFPSIRREILFGMVKRRVKEHRTLELLHRIITECPGGEGLPIGMYTSQIFSAFYLDEFDHWCKEALGLRHCYRYMDDIVVLSRDKRLLHHVLDAMRRKLAEYGLEVKANWAVFPIEKRRLDFMGYVHRHGGLAIRKRTKISYIRACNLIIRTAVRHGKVTGHMLHSMLSYEGMLSWCDGEDLVKKYSERVEFALEWGRLP